MALTLECRPEGRLSLPVDEEKEPLRRRVREFEKKLDLPGNTLEVKELLTVYEEFRNRGLSLRDSAGYLVIKRQGKDHGKDGSKVFLLH